MSKRPRLQAPAGLIAKINLGRGPGGLARYLTSKGEAARVLVSTFASGADHRGWVMETRALQQLAPRVQRSVVHMSLSAPVGVAVDDEQFKAAAVAYLQSMGVDPDVHGWALVRHEDTRHAHAHIMLSAVNPVTKRAWSDRHSYSRNMKAAAEAARAAGIVPPPPREGPPPPSSRAIKAGHREARRAAKRGTAPEVMTPAQMAEALRAAVEAAHGHNERRLAEEARGRGLELELSRATTGRISGLKVRRAGGETWVKGSSLGRDLSWPQISKRLSTTTASEGAAMSQQQQQPESGPADHADPLAFLSQPTPTRVDAPAEPADDRDARRREREQEAREAAAAEVDDTLRKASTRTLVWLRSLDTHVPKELLSQAQVERLIMLCVKLVTFGLVNLQSPAAAELAARAELARRAKDELARRREEAQRAPVRGGLPRVLRDERDAVEHRRLAIGARASMRALARLSPNAQRPPALTEAAWDARRRAAGMPTIHGARQAERESALQLQAVEADRPRGLVLMQLAEVRRHRVRLERAQATRRARQVELQALMLLFEAAQRGELALFEAEQDAAARADAREAAELEREVAELDKSIATASQSRPSQHQAEGEDERLGGGDAPDYAGDTRHHNRPSGG